MLIQISKFQFTQHFLGLIHHVYDSLDIHVLLFNDLESRQNLKRTQMVSHVKDQPQI